MVKHRFTHRKSAHPIKRTLTRATTKSGKVIKIKSESPTLTKCKTRLIQVGAIAERACQLTSELAIMESRFVNQMSMARLVTVKNLEEVETKCQYILNASAKYRSDLEEPNGDQAKVDIDCEFKEMTSKLEEFESYAKSQLEQIEREKEEEIKVLERQLKEYQNLSSENKTKVEQLEASLENAQSERNIVEKLKENLLESNENLEKELISAQERQAMMEDNYAALREQFDSTKFDLESLKLSFIGQTSQFDTLNVRYEKCSSARNALELEIEKKNSQLTNLSKKLEAFEKERFHYLNEMESLKARFEDRSNRYGNVVDAIRIRYEKELAETRQRCVDVENSFHVSYSEHEREQAAIIADLESKNTSLYDEKHSLSAKFCSMEVEIVTLKTTLDEKIILLNDLLKKFEEFNRRFVDSSEDVKRRNDDMAVLVRMERDEKNKIAADLFETQKLNEKLADQVDSKALRNALTVDDWRTDADKVKQQLVSLLDAICDLTHQSCDDDDERNAFLNMGASEMIEILKKRVGDASFRQRADADDAEIVKSTRKCRLSAKSNADRQPSTSEGVRDGLVKSTPVQTYQGRVMRNRRQSQKSPHPRLEKMNVAHENEVESVANTEEGDSRQSIASPEYM